MPRDWSFSQAAANAVSGATASNTAARVDRAQATTVVVIGASGGIGSLIVRILAARGMNVIGVCGPGSFQMVSGLGATHVIDYNAGTLSETVDQGSFPIDVVVDCVGGTVIESQAREIHGRDGQFLTLVGPEKHVGDRPLGFRLGPMLISMAMKSVVGYIRRPRYIVVNGSLDWKNVEKYQIGLNADAIIAQEIAFDKEAIRRGIATVASHHTKGKIVILLERV